jgi:Zn-dependent peptidase ImmA (M78 family)
MLNQYADVVDADIPIRGVDGVCLNLKTPGKKTRVLINALNPPLRRRFTEAHELGHIIIPWHKGTIVDHLDPSHPVARDDYWTFEDEANQFAAELLMPSAWMQAAIDGEHDLAALHRSVSSNCRVSALAASRRLATMLPKNIAFICEKGGEVEFSGRTELTLANVPAWGTAFNRGLYKHAKRHYSTTLGVRSFHWWVFPDEVAATAADERPWREILNQIVDDIGIAVDDRSRFKMSVNGVLSAANSAVKQQGRHTKDSVVAACLQRFNDRRDLNEFAQHPLFLDFVVKRSEELTR